MDEVCWLEDLHDHVEWPLYFAGLTTAIMPLIVVYLIFQRQFVRGFAAAPSDSPITIPPGTSDKLPEEFDS